jgi:hypothetical protein
MDILWLILGLVLVLTIAAVVYYSFYHVSVAEVLRARIMPGQDPPVSNNLLPLLNPEQEVQKQQSPPQLMERQGTQFIPPQEATTDNEEDGIEVNDAEIESIMDKKFGLVSTHPGMRGGQLMLMHPIRRSIALCREGGFLRKYGNGKWRKINKAILGGTNVSYNGKGYFSLTEGFNKSLLLKDEANEYHKVTIVMLTP